MSNNLQNNCNPNNKMRIGLLKKEWVKLRMNQECVENEIVLIVANIKVEVKFLARIKNVV